MLLGVDSTGSMGCWNKTCGLTNLHIYAGTPVYVFILVEPTYGGDDSSPNSIYDVCPTPFYSHYDDYGGGEDSSGSWVPYLISGFSENLIEKEVGENEYHDIEVKREGFDLEKFFETVHEKRLYLLNRRRMIHNDGSFKGKEEVRVSFTMLHKSIVDRLLDEIPVQIWRNEGGFKKLLYRDFEKEIPDFCKA